MKQVQVTDQSERDAARRLLPIWWNLVGDLAHPETLIAVSIRESHDQHRMLGATDHLAFLACVSVQGCLVTAHPAEQPQHHQNGSDDRQDGEEETDAWTSKRRTRTK